MAIPDFNLSVSKFNSTRYHNSNLLPILTTTWYHSWYFTGCIPTVIGRDQGAKRKRYVKILLEYFLITFTSNKYVEVNYMLFKSKKTHSDKCITASCDDDAIKISIIQCHLSSPPTPSNCITKRQIFLENMNIIIKYIIKYSRIECIILCKGFTWISLYLKGDFAYPTQLFGTSDDYSFMFVIIVRVMVLKNNNQTNS